MTTPRPTFRAHAQRRGAPPLALKPVARAARAWGHPQAVRLAPTLLGLALLCGAPLDPAFGQATPALDRNLPNPCSTTNVCAGFGGRGPIVAPVGSGAATITSNGTQMTVTQGSSTSLLNWRSFDIANGNSVLFNHSANQNFVSINRIHDTQASRIAGNLSAPRGQIYLINPNGLLFNSSASVDVAGLIASTLDISESRVLRGLVGDSPDRAAFSLVADNPLAAAASVQIDAGAVLRAGNIYVFAPTVSNAGQLSVGEGGQVVLAAGQRAFLAGSDSATLRGLLVEVAQGGTVTHSGEILTPRGSTTLVGMAVNQNGRITATSAINENGSIWLRAREVASDASTPAQRYTRGENPFTASFLNPQRSGSVTVGSGSTTQVLLDATDTGTAPLTDANAAQARSTIVVDGAQVRIGGDAPGSQTLLQARGGDITVQARTDADAILGVRGRVLGAENAQATLNIGADARLDASGERNVQVDGARNFVYIDRLTSNDLRDAPTQRDGFLRGQGVYVNVAQDHAFIDLGGRRAAVAGTQAERNATAGTIALRAEGSVNVAQGASFDVSGGSTVTSTATGRTSQLVTADGRVIDIMRATAGEHYVGFADRVTRSVDAPREGISTTTVYDAPRLTTVNGGVEGKNAGTLEIIAPRGQFAGSVTGTTTPAPSQRGANAPLGGELRIGSVTGAASATLDEQIEGLSRAHVLLTADPDNAATAVPGSQQDRLLTIDTGLLRRGGIGRLSVVSDGVITVTREAPIDVGPRGQISLQGNAVQVSSDLVAAGGNIVVGERPAAAAAAGERDALNLVGAEDRGSVRFGAGVVLDAGGRFVNDALLPAGRTPTEPILRDGGSIAIDGRRVDVADVARFDVDAGATVSASGAVVGGRAGSLSIRASDTSASTATDPDAGRLTLGEGFADRVAAHGFTQGGRLTIGAPRISFGSEDRVGSVRIGSELLDRGFESMSFNAADALEVQAGATLAPRVATYVADARLRLAPSQAGVDTLISPQVLAPLQQRSAQLSLSANRVRGRIDVETGASIDVGTQGSLSISAGEAVTVDGSLQARGGSVAVGLRNLEQSELVSLDLAAAQRRAIHLGAGASIDVSGVSRLQVDAAGRQTGSVLDGGSVSLTASQGSFAMDSAARIVADGSSAVIDLPGAGSAGPVRTPVASRGGSVAIAAMQSLIVNGDVSARAGGASVEGGRLSVRFDGLNASDRSALQPAGSVSEVYESVFRADRVLSLDNAGLGLPELGDPFLASTYAGRSHVSGALINDSGFDTVWLASTNTIEAAGNLSLSTRGALTLDAQALRVGPDASLSLRGSSVAIGSQQSSNLFAANEDAAARGGSGRLDVAARTVTVSGHSVLQGVGQARLAADGDVQLRGSTLQDGRYTGRLVSAGDLEIVAAQVTPATQSDFTLEVRDNPGGRLAILPSGSAPLEPLSAAGRVELRAPRVSIDGRISAPHGRIAVDGSESVRLGPQAVLSVAGTQDVPYGTVFNSAQWIYGDDPNLTGADIAGTTGVVLPEKRIRIGGGVVDVDPGARLDIRGGGEVVAQEFIAGPGGSIDVRQNFVPDAAGASQRNSFFALIPSRGDAAAPYDPQLYAGLAGDAARGGSGLLRVGQTLTIGAGSEIPAGTYTVMPARYALLPGAYALQPVSGYGDLSPAQAIQESSGTRIVAGRLGVDGAGSSTDRWSGYRVYNGAQFRRLAEFREYTGSSFFAEAAAAAGEVAPRVARDAGALSVAAEELRLATASLRAAAAPATAGRPAGRGAEVALSAPEMLVIDQAEAMPDAPSATAVFNAAALSDLRAETLVLGAAAARGDGSAAQRDRLSLGRVARSVTLGGTQALSAGELILAATGDVNVGVGSAVTADVAQAPRTRQVDLAGDGAALLVSQAERLPVWARSGSSGASGDLNVAEAARLAGRSVLFDASREQRYAPSVTLEADNLGLSASSVNLGAVPAGTFGLNLDDSLLERFGTIGSLAITSGSAFNVYGNAELGSDALRSLTLDGAGFVARAADPAAAPDASARIRAGEVTLRNSAASLPTELPAVPGSGRLEITATGAQGASGTLRLEGGSATQAVRELSVRGFAGTTLTATGRPDAASGTSADGTGQLLMSGRGALRTDGDLTLDAVRITAERAAAHDLRTEGSLRTLAGSPASTATTTELGASLTLTGRSIEHGGRIELPSGRVELAATGAAGDVSLTAGSVIRAAGSTQTFARQTADASAGSVHLRSADGSVRLLAGSRVDLAGAGASGDAGLLRIEAVRGTTQLDGRIDLQASAAVDSTARGGEVVVDVGTLPDLGSLARPLAAGTAGAAPLDRLDVRVRRGDVLLAADDGLAARTLRLAADGADNATRPADGQIRIDGRLDASGERGGRVELYARDSITLGGTARIDAHATGADQEAGSVLLSARINAQAQPADAPRDALRIVQGARIDLRAFDGDPSGGILDAALGGTVTLRAPRVGSSEVAIRGEGAPAGAEALPTDYLVGARQEIVEATVVRTLSGSTTFDSQRTSMQADLQAYMSTTNRDAMAARLGRSSLIAADNPFHLRPGLEVRSGSNLTLASFLDFSAGLGSGAPQWRYGGSTAATSEPGAITLRSERNVSITGGLWDGYTQTGGNESLNTLSGRLTPFAQGDSWRYQIVAGADSTAAAPASVIASTTQGDVSILPQRFGGVTNVAQVRTGTGRIDVSAGRDIVLNGANVAVFTGGTASVEGPVFENAAVRSFAPTFTQQGGDVVLRAERDITTGNNPATQLVNNWLWRAGRSSDGDFSGSGNAPTAWWVNAATFTQGVGALGGGDLEIEAGRNIRSLNTAVPSNAFLDTGSGELVEHNRGTLSVRAGDTLAGGVHYAQAGQIDLRARTVIQASSQDPLVVAQGGNVARVQAQQDARIFGAINPTWTPSPAVFTGPANLNSPMNTAFTTYDGDSRLSVASLTGLVELGQGSVIGSTRTSQAASSTLVNSTTARAPLFTILPPNVDLVSFGGDVAAVGNRWLAPSPDGQLRLLADGGVRGGVIAMMDLDPAPSAATASEASVPTVTAPSTLSGLGERTADSRAFGGYNLNSSARHAALDRPLHAGDRDPVAVVARTGDLTGLRLDVPKAAEVFVAGDIGGGARISVQNVDDADVTRIHAGGRIDFNATGGDADAAAVQIGGPGIAEILSGRDINLGGSAGIVSRGNLNNPNLAERGATLVVMSGLGQGPDGFVRQPDYAQVLRNFVRYDAFAAAGREAGSLNAQALREADIADAQDRAVLERAIRDRTAAGQSSSEFETWLGALSPATRLRLALELAQRVQAVANQRFVATANTDSFAPGYLVLRDLFPGLSSNVAGLRAFVRDNPFAASADGAALQRQAVEGLPEPLRRVLELGLDDPTQVADPASAFNRGLAELDAALLAQGSRQLLAQAQTVAGSALDGLRAAGRVGARVGTPFARGLDEFARAFSPEGSAGANGISLVFSQIKTEQSGDLFVLAPRGGVLVGLANPPAGAIDKQPYQLGLLTLGGGDVFGAVRDNFDVYRSRVFTTAGGDIHLWASQGNVDAGRGPRDTAVVPPPRLEIDSNGVVTLDITASVSGSGIGALRTRDDQPPSSIRLIAPNGFIDAGEAGIRADSGTVTLGTNIVLNAGNISAGGGVAGGAVVVAPPAPVPQASNATQADKSVEQTQKTLAAAQQEAEERAKKERRKRVTGEFIGFGDN